MTDDGGSGLSRRDALRILAVAGVSVGVGGPALAALLRSGSLRRVSITGTRMGTLVTLTVVHPDAGAARRMARSTLAEMERLEGLLSRHRSSTPLARLNREGAVEGAPLELLEVIEAALAVSRLSDGAFDPTVLPLLSLYEGSFASRGAPPSSAEVEDARARVGYRGLGVEGGTVRLADPAMAVTLDGVAKGYIVDRALAHLVEAGADRAMVDGGGDLAATERRGAGWTVGVRDPRRPADTLGRLHLDGGGVATSGDYMRAFTADRRHHHLIDPRTGRSPEGASSVTVVAPSAMEADALSTAALVLGPEEGRAFLEARPGAEGLLVAKGGERFRTAGYPPEAG